MLKQSTQILMSTYRAAFTNQDPLSCLASLIRANSLPGLHLTTVAQTLLLQAFKCSASCCSRLMLAQTSAALTRYMESKPKKYSTFLLAQMSWVDISRRCFAYVCQLLQGRARGRPPILRRTHKDIKRHAA